MKNHVTVTHEDGGQNSWELILKCLVISREVLNTVATWLNFNLLHCPNLEGPLFHYYHTFLSDTMTFMHPYTSQIWLQPPNFSMAMFRYGVLFPNSIVTATFGTWALSKGHKVTLYSPGGAHDIILKALVTDLTVLAVERSRLRNEPNDSLQVKALPNFLGC